MYLLKKNGATKLLIGKYNENFFSKYSKNILKDSLQVFENVN